MIWWPDPRPSRLDSESAACASTTGPDGAERAREPDGVGLVADEHEVGARDGVGELERPHERRAREARDRDDRRDAGVTGDLEERLDPGVVDARPRVGDRGAHVGAEPLAERLGAEPSAVGCAVRRDVRHRVGAVRDRERRCAVQPDGEVETEVDLDPRDRRASRHRVDDLGHDDAGDRRRATRARRRRRACGRRRVATRRPIGSHFVGTRYLRRRSRRITRRQRNPSLSALRLLRPWMRSVSKHGDLGGAQSRLGARGCRSAARPRTRRCRCRIARGSSPTCP